MKPLNELLSEWKDVNRRIQAINDERKSVGNELDKMYDSPEIRALTERASDLCAKHTRLAAERDCLANTLLEAAAKE